jgi:transcriptional regulator with XRE-family HTH domain
MNSFCGRLVEERKKRKLNQTKFGALGGVSKGAQINYESGERSPDVDYLAGLAAAGVDVAYLLTGKRSLHVAEDAAAYDLRPDQVALLDNYENCPDESKRFIARVALNEAQRDDDSNGAAEA